MTTIKQVRGYEEYFIGEDGTVYKKMKPWIATSYLDIKFKGKHHLIHRLVAEHFVENPDSLKEVNHKDGDKMNNEASNLEWVTRSENLAHAREELGDTPVKNFRNCDLLYKGELVSSFRSIAEASKYASETYGVSEAMMNKWNENKDCMLIVK